MKSDWKKDENMAGDWNHTSGKWTGDANDKGMHSVYAMCSFTAHSANYSFFACLVLAVNYNM